MKRRGVEALAVVEGDDTLVGVFCIKDIAKRVALEELDPASTTVSQVMTRHVEGIGGELPFEEALEMVSN